MLPDKYSLPKTSRLPDQVAAVLIDEMEKGVLRAGDMLPSEEVLAEKFGVSRAVIREALSQLKYEGLVSSRQGKGAMVMGSEGRRFLRFPELDNYNVGDMAQLFELRAILESEAAGLAATRRSLQELSQLRIHLQGMAEAVAENSDGVLPDFEFHKTIAQASGNQHLCALMQFLNQRILRMIETARTSSSRTAGLPEKVHQEHQAIFSAIEAGNAGQAKEASFNHFCNAANRLGLGIFSQKKSGPADRRD
ncbi:MAG: FadR/GntR family transcriptional regulator [Desulfarculaceae bacterium]|jgi:GntR family transcriptional repressor for pyruvate dehydrogenase complex